MKGDRNYLVGFALETRDGESYAKQKLIEKNASAIVLNTLGKEGVGFETDTNEVSVYTATGKTFSFPLTSKIALGKSLRKHRLITASDNALEVTRWDGVSTISRSPHVHIRWV